MSTTTRAASDRLALRGGPKAVRRDPGDMFTWPIVTQEDERAVLEVLRAGKMSDLDVTRQFEAEFARWQGLPYALAHCNGTAALQAAMYAVGVRGGDEVICPSMTYWASGLPALTLKATVVWADIQRHSLCLDPADVEKRITRRTKAIVVVHYAGYPADVDEIMAVAEPHGVQVIEDVSHAHGGLCKGRKLGTIGHVAAMSMMSGKSFAIGEGGMLATADRHIYERAVAWGHYERHSPQAGDLTDPELIRLAGLPLGGVKHRINQLASAMGRVQLKYYDRRNAEILKAMNYFWDSLEGTPGVRAHRPPRGSDSEMGGWYHARGLYVAEQLDGLPLARFCEALRAEGFPTAPGANLTLHLHPVVNDVDVYGDGKPTILAQADRDVRAPAGSLPVAEAIAEFCFGVPWFKHYRPEVIDEYVLAVKKVAVHADELGS
ncbi:MAG: hypothetical protein AMJ81_03880 [Phycisphaerae bacterium SM23_33]|nr:MAG: hypothetical protein AMJ81_03880 [Phycisphaerae bacterium SM23_33]